MKTLSIDIETYSSEDLSKCGVYRYAEAPDFEILLFGYAADGGPVQVVDLTGGEIPPAEIVDALTDNAITKWAFNAQFERVCLSRWLHDIGKFSNDGYGGTDEAVSAYLDPAGWRCSMVWASCMGLPLSLGAAGAALGLEKQKLEEGKELIRYFCKPCKPTKANGRRVRNRPEHDLGKWKLFKAYNARDVEAEMQIQEKLSKYPLPEFVWDEYHIDQTINDRGVLLDEELAGQAVVLDAEAKEVLTDKMQQLTKLQNPNSVQQLTNWLANRGIQTTSLDKKTVRELLAGASPEVREVLKLRQQTSKSSVKKYTAMEAAVCRDGRIRGMFQFCGAGRTGRWAGRLVQLQNLPQNHLPDLDHARTLVRQGDFKTLQQTYENVPDTLSQLIRTAFIPRNGCQFYVADFSAIEARVIAWYAGEEWRQKVFEDGGDIYCASASQMFGVPVVKHGVNGHLRQKGKIAELALGYGGSVGALKAMGALEMGLKAEELPGLVEAWRTSNPKIVQFWWDVDNAAKDALNGHTRTAGKLTFYYESGRLFIELPSGRRLAYMNARKGINKFGNEAILYDGVNAARSWATIETYGPKLVENIVQATARDILCNSMRILRKERIVMHIHDELVIEADPGARLEDLCEQMGQTPAWAEGLQLRADGYITQYYKKDDAVEVPATQTQTPEAVKDDTISAQVIQTQTPEAVKDDTISAPTTKTRKLKIAYGDSREAKHWSNKTIRWDALCKKLSEVQRTTETVEEYQHMKPTDKATAKDKGGFVAGHLRNNRRKRENVTYRSMLVFDLDYLETGQTAEILKQIQNTGCWYSTHSHTADRPRLRLVLPLARDVTPDEFNAVSRFYAQETELLKVVDKCSFMPHQLMYWPSCPADGEFLHGVTEGPWLDPDGILAAHPEWKDIELLPTTPKESQATGARGRRQQDPLEKKGIIGAVCRTYTMTEALAKFLPDVYEPSVNNPNRYTYIKGEGVAGLVVYDNKFAYSHHTTDPASEQLCNVFDLIRIHKFSDEDEKSSRKKAENFFREDEAVKLHLIQDRMIEAAEDFDAVNSADNWRRKLELNQNGGIRSNLRNLLLIIQNEPELQGIAFNQLANTIEHREKLPWNPPEKYWRDADDSQLICWVTQRYTTFTKGDYITVVTKIADDNKYHPVLEYLTRLPAWDGVPRVDCLLIDFLGADDSAYVRAVTRKTLCAAVRRVQQPGIKFDYMLVLNGPQGIGKSTLVSKLGGEWYTDSLRISDMDSKAAAEKVQGYWIIEIGELAGMKKADVECTKQFISSLNDNYRVAYGRHATPHPRQCIFIGTTNAEGYLRDPTGNRRFWNVRVTGESDRKPWELTEYEIQQVWKEALILAQEEDLFLGAELESYAQGEQRAAMEEDPMESQVRRYLDLPLPTDWANRSIPDRRQYIQSELDGDGIEAPGTKQRQFVSNIEIWCECFGYQKERCQKQDNYRISSIMASIEGWTKTGDREYLDCYGRQRVYRRKDTKNYAADAEIVDIGIYDFSS